MTHTVKIALCFHAHSRSRFVAPKCSEKIFGKRPRITLEDFTLILSTFPNTILCLNFNFTATKKLLTKAVSFFTAHSRSRLVAPKCSEKKSLVNGHKSHWEILYQYFQVLELQFYCNYSGSTISTVHTITT